MTRCQSLRAARRLIKAPTNFHWWARERRPPGSISEYSDSVLDVTYGRDNLECQFRPSPHKPEVSVSNMQSP